MLFTKKHLFLILTICYFLPLFGQEKQTAVKLSANLYRSGIANDPDFQREINKSNTAIFSVSVLFFNNRKFHYQEISLSRISHRKVQFQEGSTSQTVIGAKYEYGVLGKQLNNYFKFRYGGALDFYYGNNNYESNLSYVFPEEQTFSGVMLAFSPHLDFALSERFFIDLNPSLVLLNYYFEKNRTKNPTLPEEAQEQGSIGLDAGGLLLQIGVGYKW